MGHGSESAGRTAIPRVPPREFPAGPSEVLVIADASANAAFVASDLLSQAEHGADSQVLLLTTSIELANEVAAAIDAQKGASAAPRHGGRRACALEYDRRRGSRDCRRDFEPLRAEHLILQIERPREWLPRIQAAGSVFLGPWTPESVGDYCSGTNHVLPTYGYARRYSGAWASPTSCAR